MSAAAANTSNYQTCNSVEGNTSRDNDGGTDTSGKLVLTCPHLIGVDAVVDGPCGLKILQHPLLQLLRETMHADEVFQILHARVVERAAGVHALDDGRDVSKNDGVHQSWR